MGHIVKKAVGISNSGMKKLDPFRGGDAILEAHGIPTFTGEGSSNILDMGRTAAAEAADAAEAQAQAQRDQANQIAQAQREASQVQAAAVRDQTAASVAAQTATINQAAVAAQLADAAKNAPQEGTPDIQLTGAGDSSDPRRKYTYGGTSSIGGTSGGVGIRL